jgi:hypothetical protein
MLAGSMFYVHLLHSSSLEWHYALHDENTALFSGVRMTDETSKHVRVERK